MKNHVVVVGSGWGADRFLKGLDYSQYKVTVISPTDYFLYTPKLLYSAFYNYDPALPLPDHDSIRYIKDSVVSIMFEDNDVYTESGDAIPYDYLVFAQGSSIQTFNIRGVTEHCICIKDLASSEQLHEVLSGESGKNVAVIGCGLAGTDLIGMLIDQQKHHAIAIDAMKLPLNTLSESISRYTLDYWREKKVTLHFGNFVNLIDDNYIYIGKEMKQAYDVAVWCGGIKANALTTKVLDLLDFKGYKGIPVNEYLKVEKRDNIYALGDCAESKHPPTAQVAAQQGRYLANYFNNGFSGSPFQYKNKGVIGYIGGGEGVYQKGDFVVRGKVVGLLLPFIHLYTQWVS